MDNPIKEQLCQIFPNVDGDTIEYYLNEAKRSAVDGDSTTILPMCIDLVLGSQTRNNNQPIVEQQNDDIVFLGRSKGKFSSKQSRYPVVYIEDGHNKEIDLDRSRHESKWDTELSSPTDSSTDSDSDKFITPSTVKTYVSSSPTSSLSPTAQLRFITQMFPNVNSDQIKKLAIEGKSLDDIVCYVLEHPEMSTPLRTSVQEPNAQPRKKEINYYTDNLATVSSQYEAQCFALLKNDFRTVYANDIRLAMTRARYHYAPTHKLLENAVLSMDHPQNQLSSSAESDANEPCLPFPKSPQVSPCQRQSSPKTFVITQFLGRKRPKISLPSIVEELSNEVNFVKKQKTLKEEMKDLTYAQHLNEEQYKEEGQLIECGCCFGEFPFEEVVQCNDGHLFCCQCLQSYSKEVIFGSAISTAKLQCMTNDCAETFPYSQLRKALSEEEIGKYQDRLQEDCLIKVDLPNLVQCPHCEFKAIVADTEKVFTCLKPTCLKMTCLDCQEDWKDHVGLKCSEVEKKSHTNLRVSYEERMTNAKVRKCSKCSCSFTKSEGCNKMTCRCGTKMCYICRKPNIDYGHFCRHLREPGKKCSTCTACSLWTDPKEDDDMAIRQLEKEAKMEKRKLDEANVSIQSKKQKVSSWHYKQP